MKEPDQPPDSPENEEYMICPSCHAPNDPWARYCAQCNVPLDGGVMLDPIGQIQAQGFALRQATTGHPNLTIVIGIWLLFLPGLVAGVCLLAVVLSEFRWSRPGLLIWVLPFGFIAVPSIVLYLTTANYLRRRSKLKKAAKPPTAG